MCVPGLFPIFLIIYCRCEIFSYWLTSHFRADGQSCQHRFCTTVGEIFISHSTYMYYFFLCVVAWLFFSNYAYVVAVNYCSLKTERHDNNCWQPAGRAPQNILVSSFTTASVSQTMHDRRCLVRRG